MMARSTMRGALRHVWALPCALAAASHGYANDAVTPTQFAVTEGGAATLSIPIKVPRGIGGLEPDLKLNYASDAGNGILGLGWVLTGPSAITRCGRTLLDDRIDAVVTFDSTSDRFCLDGQRLLRVDGADPNVAQPQDSSYADMSLATREYRTQRDSFSRVRSVKGSTNVPSGFLVETKSGLILDYGNTLPGDTSNLTAQVSTTLAPSVTTIASTILRWNLQRIRDRNGNAVEFFYCAGRVEGNSCNPAVRGATPLHYIRYTGRVDRVSGARQIAGTFGVVFRYEDRPDVRTSYYRGTMSRQTQRLVGVDTYVDFAGPGTGSLVRRYDIAYQPIETASISERATTVSLVASIQEVAASGEAMPKITLKYPPDKVLGMGVAHRVGTTANTLAPRNECGGYLGGKVWWQCE